MNSRRGSGILVHISSLISPFGIGDLGKGAYQFADFLSAAGQKYWQVLPLNPTSSINCNSPYSSISAFAANNIFISPEILIKERLLENSDLKTMPSFSKKKVEYDKIYGFKEDILTRAFRNYKKQKKTGDFEAFSRDNDYWLEDYACFIVFKEVFGDKSWTQWPEQIKNREITALENLKKKYGQDIEKKKFFQYIFYKQWHTLKNYAREKGIQIIGDIPIYVNYDSVDVWCHPEIFKLDENKNLKYLAGVPPDYFSKTGQLWGNPVYDWGKLKKSKFGWWIKRIEHNLTLFDYLRIDHFRGFVDFWQVPAGEETAINGAWEKAPSEDFFKAVLEKFPKLPIIAEDLGIITDEVKEAIKRFGFPGMKILLFAFFEDLEKHPYLPHNYPVNCVAYTGTHDNNTIRGWFENELSDENKKKLFSYLKKEISVNELNWELIRILLESKADMVIIPAQDILGLGQENRMNLPGVAQGNWQWRLTAGQLNEDIQSRLVRFTSNTNRINKL